MLIVKALVISMCMANSIMAKDLGKYGNSQEIIEQDLVEYITNKLRSMEPNILSAHQETISNKIITKIKHPMPVSGVTQATENKARLYDPSFTVHEDIIDNFGNIIHKAGTKINPLDYIPFNEEWIFIDGDDNKQREFANKQLKLKPNSKVILVRGKPGYQTNEEFYYFDQSGEICKKLSITKVPTIVRQAENQNIILIEEILLEESKTSSK